MLGMHRSGTSALARVLNLLDFHLGDSLLGAREGNASGHWEPIPVIEINERVLAALGRTWSDLRQMQTDWLQNAEVRALLPEASLLLAHDYMPRDRWSIKDPRISRLLPFWLQAMSQESARCSAVISVRHPWEVAASLNRRDGIPLSQGLLLWWQHTSEALTNSRGLSRVIVSYSRLMRDWVGEVKRVFSAIGIALPTGADMPAAEEIARFLDQGARHEIHDSSKHRVPAVLQEFYDALCEAGDEEAIRELEERAKGINFGSECHELALTDLYVHRERLHHRVVELEIASQKDWASVHAAEREELTLELRRFSEHLTHADWVNTELEKKWREADGALASATAEVLVQSEVRAALEQRLGELDGIEDKLVQAEKALHGAEKRHRAQLEQDRARLAELRRLQMERDILAQENKVLCGECRSHQSKLEQLSVERDMLAQRWQTRLFKVLGNRGN